MGAESTVLGVVIAVVGVIGSVLVARVSAPRPAPAGPPVDLDDDRPPVLEVSPDLFQHFSGRIRGLEDKVDHLTELVEAQTIRVTALEKLLRQAMRLLRRAHQQLRVKGHEPDPVPPELIPYSID
ncbi:hypothetical protein [Streptomyces erythrochromogenes]|uniref:hypothetical protein n=1 Tax=Streptomyces erythrochromogenes TaxID=285574 RepID=UPI00224D04B4|nr:hypothetical protein [Streptomyces erythrochromogenes]MCX5587532.1 hypothetical protein [Streptomyces erythrochromogenes]